jgi:hypothetical protein
MPATRQVESADQMHLMAVSSAKNSHRNRKEVLKMNKTLLTFIACAPLFLSACGGGSSDTASTGTTDASTDTSKTLSGTATKGPIDAATVTAYALNSDGSRGEYLGSTTSDAAGAYTLEVDHEGAVAVVVTDGTYVDEATGMAVTLPEGVELETLLSSVDETEPVAVTALTTIAAAHARENASAGLEVAITNANTATANAFGLSNVDIAATVPSDLSSLDASTDGLEEQSYGMIQAGLTQLAEDAQLAPEDVLALVAQMAQDFTDGTFDGKDSAGAALNFTLSVTPQEALVGLQSAMENFLASPENLSGVSIPEITIPTAGDMLSGQAMKGPVADANVLVYALNEDGSRGTLLAQTTTDAKGLYSVPMSAEGPVAVVVRGGSYKDEATGTTVALDQNELETLVADASLAREVAVTALTTIAAKKAAADAASGLETAIASANADVAALFGVDGVDISAVIPVDLTDESAAEANAEAQAYGLALAALTQVAENDGLAPEEVLALVANVAQDFTDGALDGLNARGEALDLAISLSPDEALTALNTAKTDFLASPENASGLATVPEIPGVDSLLP